MSESDRFTVLSGGPTGEEREARLAAGAEELAAGGRRSSILGNERFLLALSAGLMSFGLCAILLGWLGAAHSTLLEQQVPYLISGGLVGVALSTIGAVALLAHWLTVLIREARDHEVARRQDHEEHMDALRSLARPLDDREEDLSNGRARGARSERPIRRTPRGS